MELNCVSACLFRVDCCGNNTSSASSFSKSVFISLSIPDFALPDLASSLNSQLLLSRLELFFSSLLGKFRVLPLLPQNVARLSVFFWNGLSLHFELAEPVSLKFFFDFSHFSKMVVSVLVLLWQLLERLLQNGMLVNQSLLLALQVADHFLEILLAALLPIFGQLAASVGDRLHSCVFLAPVLISHTVFFLHAATEPSVICESLNLGHWPVIQIVKQLHIRNHVFSVLRDQTDHGVTFEVEAAQLLHFGEKWQDLVLLIDLVVTDVEGGESGQLLDLRTVAHFADVVVGQVQVL